MRAAPTLVRLVRTIAAGEGFCLHEGKLRFHTAAQRQAVTGIVVNRHPNVVRADYGRLSSPR